MPNDPSSPAAAPPRAKPAGPPRPKLKIEHQVPGRIRMKVRSAKGKPELLEAYRDVLAVIPGIDKVETNPETGSILLLYDPDRHDSVHADFHEHYREHHDRTHRPPSDEISKLAAKIEEEAEFLAEHSHVARVFVDFCKQCDRQIKVATGNTLDLKMMLALGVIGVTVFEVGATAATPVWVTLALFGLNHFIEMQEERLQAETVQA